MLTDAADLLACLRRLSLLPPERLRKAESLAAGLPARQAADALVARGWLSAFQADELSQGRGLGLMVGSYVLLDRLGAGGMGEVFRARSRGTGREVALKRMLPRRTDPRGLRRFSREVAAASSLSHPNVVRVYEAGEEGGLPFLAMELLAGVDLSERLRSGPVPVGEAIEYVRQACLGMQHAHERGLVHRDLKPSNLMLTTGGTVKVLDLGLALVADVTTMTRTGQFIGTVDYVAPEQVTDPHGVDIRADVYSLGCTLYHLLAGKVPFDAAHPAVRPALHRDTEPPAIESLCGAMPQPLPGVVRKMMAKQREKRFATPGEAAEVLAAFPQRVRVGPPPLPSSPPAATKASASSVATKRTGGLPTSSPPGPAPARATNHDATPRRGGDRVWRVAAVLGGALLLLCVLPLVFLIPSKDRGARTGDETARRDERRVPPPANEKEPGPLGPTPKTPGDARKAEDVEQADEAKKKADQKAKADADKKEADDTKKLPAKSFTNTLDMKFARVPAGKFTMGSPKDEADRAGDETAREVELTKPFYLGVYEVTQGQWKKVMEKNPSCFSLEGDPVTVEGLDAKGRDDLPVDSVHHAEAEEFIAKLNQRERRFGRRYRLPTEAEWEYACRGGKTTRFHFGDALGAKDANFTGKLRRPEPVGSYPANAWGLHDMHGNVAEWCADPYGDYKAGPVKDPRGPDKGEQWVIRGGGWSDSAAACRSAARDKLEGGQRTLTEDILGPNARPIDLVVLKRRAIGFRVAVDVD